LRLADILRQHWPEYVAGHGGVGKIPTPHWQAVEAVLACGTPRLGGHVYGCTDCGTEHFAYHSCNHCACPRCGGQGQQEWAARQEARLLPVPYFMLTFTVPELAAEYGFLNLGESAGPNQAFFFSSVFSKSGVVSDNTISNSGI
jgi:hypothetical protein